MGALIAFSLKGKRHGDFPLSCCQVFSLAGLGLIAYGFLTFSKETPVPGLSALIPTVGAGLIIAFALPGTLVGRLLVSRVLVGVGLISYSAYLWHQLLLSFTRHRSFTEPANGVIVLIVPLAFGLAYATWRYIEQPVRQRQTITNRVIGGLGLMSAMGIIFCAASLRPSVVEFQSQLG